MTGVQLDSEVEPELPSTTRSSARRWAVFTAAVLAIGVVTAALAAGFGRDPSVVQSVLLNRPAPPLSGPTLDGGSFDLADHRGQVVLVSVWASWCEACKEEHPVLVAAQEQLGPYGLQLVGINMKDDPADARAFMETMGGERYPSVLDPDARKAVEWGTFAIPESYLVNREGIVLAKAVGAVTPEWIQQTVVPELVGGGSR